MAKTPKFKNAKVQAWVDQWIKVCTPDNVVVVKGDKKAAASWSPAPSPGFCSSA